MPHRSKPHVNKGGLSFVLQCLLCFLLAANPWNPAFSQIEERKFDIPRLQKNDHSYEYIQNDYISLYYSGETYAISKQVLDVADKIYYTIRQKSAYAPGNRLKIFLFATAHDYMNSNLGIHDVDLPIGGRRNFNKQEIVVVYNGSSSSLQRDLRKEIAQKVSDDLLYGGNFKVKVKNTYFLNLPVWFLQGLPAYLAEGYSPFDKQVLRSLLDQKDLHKTERLSSSKASITGRSIFDYITKKYGETALLNLITYVRLLKEKNEAFYRATGLGYNELVDDWRRFQQKLWYEEEDLHKDSILYSTSLSVENSGYLVSETPEAAFHYRWLQDGYSLSLFRLHANKSRWIKLQRWRYPHEVELTANQIASFKTSSGGGIAVLDKISKPYYQLMIFSPSLKKPSIYPLPKDIIPIDFNISSDEVFITYRKDRNTYLAKKALNLPSSFSTLHTWSDGKDHFLASTGKSEPIEYSLSNDTLKVQYLQEGSLRLFPNVTPIATSKQGYAAMFWDVQEHLVFGLDTAKVLDTLGFVQEGLVPLQITNNGLIARTVNQSKLFYLHHDLLLEPASAQEVIYNQQETLKLSPSKKPIVRPYHEWKYGKNLYKGDIPNIYNYDLDVDILTESKKKQEAVTETTKPYFEYKNSTIEGPMPIKSGMSLNYITTSLMYFEPIRWWGMYLEGEATSLMENHRLYARLTGFQIDLRSNDIELKYEYLKHKTDFGLSFFKSTFFLEEFSSELFERFTTNKITGEISYPISNSLAIQFNPFFQRTRYSILGPNVVQIERPDTVTDYVGFNSSLLFNNTEVIMLNIYSGTRMRIDVGGWFSGDESENFAKYSFDLRHYKPVWKKSIVAFRFMGGGFFGPAQKDFILGGVNNWIFSESSRFENSGNPDDPLFSSVGEAAGRTNWFFNEFITGTRGFRYNQLYGSKFAQVNLEYRFPLINLFPSLLSKGNFWRHFQLVGFLDGAIAWENGLPENFQQVDFTSPSDLDNFSYTASTYEKIPLLLSYGAGARFTILRFFWRVDLAYPQVRDEVLDPRVQVSIGYDF